MKKTQKENHTKNRVYGVVGMVALFLMGAIFGFIINGSDRVSTSTMTRNQCNDLAERIMSAAKNNQPDLIAQLNKVYSENCLNRAFPKPQPKPVMVEEKLPDVTCEAIEQLLKNYLVDEKAQNWDAHQYNSEIYNRLAKTGCEKNKETYQKMAQREFEIAKALDRAGEMTQNKGESTCEEIEHVLTLKLRCRGEYETCFDVDDHVRNAQIYANLSERGCAENSQKYKELAKQELEIARALTDDDISENRREATEMVETYKRLQMQAEATKMIEKAKKLTNPAIDFIIQLEKIIEE